MGINIKYRPEEKISQAVNQGPSDFLFYFEVRVLNTPVGGFEHPKLGLIRSIHSATDSLTTRASAIVYMVVVRVSTILVFIPVLAKSVLKNRFFFARFLHVHNNKR